MFDTFEPPIDPEQPRYAGLFVKPTLFDAMGMKLLNIEENELLAQWASHIEAAQVSSDLNGTWLVSSLRLDLRESAQGEVSEAKAP